MRLYVVITSLLSRKDYRVLFLGFFMNQTGSDVRKQKKEAVMKKVAIAVALVFLFASGLYAQDYLHGRSGITYNKIGGTTFGSDGSSYNNIGNTRFGSDGGTSTRIGNSTFNSDGTTSNQIGNTLFNSDGSTVNRIGDTTFGSDGKSCTKIGNSSFCN